MTNHKYNLHIIILALILLFNSKLFAATKLTPSQLQQWKSDPSWTLNGKRPRCVTVPNSPTVNWNDMVDHIRYSDKSKIQYRHYLEQRYRQYKYDLEKRKRERDKRRLEFKARMEHQAMIKKQLAECEAFERAQAEKMKFRLFKGRNGHELNAKVCGIRNDGIVYLKDQRDRRFYIPVSNFNHSDVDYLKSWWNTNYNRR